MSARIAGSRARRLSLLERLHEAPDLATGPLPAALTELYDGGLRIEPPALFANFVSSIDGVAAIESGTAPSGGIISGRNQADRFVMGLLRALADAVLVGAGTLRAEGGKALWTPEFIFPAAAEGFRELRRSLTRSEKPQLVVVTGHVDLDPNDRALQAGALVLTTKENAPVLRQRLPPADRVLAVSDGPRVEVADALQTLEREGFRSILTEGGPMLFGELLQAGRVDELFLTLSPSVAGRAEGGSLGIVRGVDFGRGLKWAQLRSVRRSGSHLFLRYRLGATT